MATRAKKAESDSEENQPYMSQYDKQVEDRLQALEDQSHAHGGDSSGLEERVAALEARIDDLVEKIKSKMSL